MISLLTEETTRQSVQRSFKVPPTHPRPRRRQNLTAWARKSERVQNLVNFSFLPRHTVYQNDRVKHNSGASHIWSGTIDKEFSEFDFSITNYSGTDPTDFKHTVVKSNQMADLAPLSKPVPRHHPSGGNSNFSQIPSSQFIQILTELALKWSLLLQIHYPHK